MQSESSQESRSQDRRVLRSRSALLTAAVRLVSERGTTAVPVTDLAEAANVSRQLVYLQFGDRDSLFVAAAVDLVSRELAPQLESGLEANGLRALLAAQHFARYRSFYRAMLTGSCAFAMTRAMEVVFSGVQKQALEILFGDVDEAVEADLTAFFAGGTGAVINTWLIAGEDPLDAEELTERLLRLVSVFAASRDFRQGQGPCA